MSRDSSVNKVTCNGPDDLGSIPGRAKIFLLATAFRPALGLTHCPTQWVPEAHPQEVRGSGLELTTYLQ
jgi:hypothetical protein